MKELSDDFVGYFGTKGCAGHFLHILNGGGCLTPMENSDWEAVFDSDAIMKCLSEKRLTIFYYQNLTIMGYPRSIDDRRPGSKSLFILGGNRDKDYITNRIKDFPWVYNIFKKLCNKYLTNK